MWAKAVQHGHPLPRYNGSPRDALDPNTAGKLDTIAPTFTTQAKLVLRTALPGLPAAPAVGKRCFPGYMAAWAGIKDERRTSIAVRARDRAWDDHSLGSGMVRTGRIRRVDESTE